jgi:hypothetical protein
MPQILEFKVSAPLAGVVTETTLRTTSTAPGVNVDALRNMGADEDTAQAIAAAIFEICRPASLGVWQYARGEGWRVELQPRRKS